MISHGGKMLLIDLCAQFKLDSARKGRNLSLEACRNEEARAGWKRAQVGRLRCRGRAQRRASGTDDRLLAAAAVVQKKG